MDQLSQVKNDFSLTGKIEKFEDKNAVISLADGQSLVWPIKNLPDEVQAGAAVKLFLSTAQSEQAELEKIAKAVLNNILKSADRTTEVVNENQ